MCLCCLCLFLLASLKGRMQLHSRACKQDEEKKDEDDDDEEEEEECTIGWNQDKPKKTKILFVKKIIIIISHSLFIDSFNHLCLFFFFSLLNIL